MTEKQKENKRVDAEEELRKQELKAIKERRKEAKAEERTKNPGKLARTAKLVTESTKGIFSKDKEENKKVKQAPKGILAKHANELAAAMKKARTRNELFQLAQLMRKQSKEIQEIARRI